MPRLYARIYLHLLGVLVAVGIATTLIFALGHRGHIPGEPAQRVIRHVTSLVTEEISSPESLARRLRQLQRDLGVDLRVSDPDGRELARAGGAVPPLRPEEAARVRGGGMVMRPPPRWVLAAPLRDPNSGALVGILEASGSPSGFERRLLRPLAAVGLLLGLLALAAMPLARRISRPIERLTEAARRLGAGDLSARAPLGPPGRRWRRRRRDEIEELTGSFNDMAQRVERLVSGQKELLANVSHELRSPLARMLLALELLPRSAESEGRLRDLEADLAELDRLIQDVLTASRLEVTGLPPHPGPVQVGPLLAEVAERARRDPLTARYTVEVRAPAGLTIVADAALLRRGLWNLVENAGKYGAPPVVLAAEQRDNRVLLSVSDMGPGIPRPERERVLEPFYRIDKVRTPGSPGGTASGFGLGLALAQRIAEVHQGSIAIEPAWEESGQERGCRVIISLPASPGVTRAE
jgi:two-component system, OmpR family, sensor kinase